MAEKIPYSELKQRLAKCPRFGSCWRHYKTGHQYVVLGSAIQEATQEPLVLYINVGSDTNACRMARPLSEWEQEVEHEGQKVKRFTPS